MKSKMLLSFYLLLIILSGCASLTEVGKGVAGVSTKVLEENRNSAIIKVFNCDFATCYNKTEEVLGHTGPYIYAKKKEMFAIYVSELDTTPVGVFLKEISASNTQIEVSSLSTNAKELIAKNLFTALENAFGDRAQDIKQEVK